MRQPTDKRIQKYISKKQIEDNRKMVTELKELFRGMGLNGYVKFMDCCSSINNARELFIINALYQLIPCNDNKLIKFKKISEKEELRKIIKDMRIESLNFFNCSWSSSMGEVRTIINDLEKKGLLSRIKENKNLKEKFELNGNITSKTKQVIQHNTKTREHLIKGYYCIDDIKVKETFGFSCEHLNLIIIQYEYFNSIGMPLNESTFGKKTIKKFQK